MKRIISCFIFLLVAVPSFASSSRVARSTRTVRAFADGCVGESCTFDTDNILLGTSEIIPGEDGTSGPDLVTYTGFTSTGSSDIQVTSDSCTGQTISNGASCSFQWTYTPSTAGQVVTNFVLNKSYYNLTNHTTTSGSVSYAVTGHAHVTPPACESQEQGSVVGADSRTVGENVPVVGTALSLSYSSRFVPGYASHFSATNFQNGFNPEGWSISNHHYLDLIGQEIYLGSGSVAAVNISVVSGVASVVSSDGSELYTFGGSGLHLATYTALTGALKYSFNYDSSGRLTSMTDAFSNVTTFNRDVNGRLSSIQAPFGQTTTIAVNGSGYISSIQDPAGQTYSITYLSGKGLLSTFTKPGGQVSTMSYDSNGYLIQDLGGGGNLWNQAQSGTFESGTISMSSALSVTTSHQTTQSSTAYTRVDALPDGNSNTHVEYIDRSLFSDSDHQKSTSVSTVNDARFGSLYRSVSSQSLTMGGSTKTTTYAQSVVYPTGVTPGYFNYQTLSTSATTASSTSTTIVTLATKLLATTSAAGRTSSVSLTTADLPSWTQLGTDTPWSFTYDSHGRISSKSQGAQNGVTYAYNTGGWLQSTTNARSEVESYGYDLAGRMTSKTLPDSRVIGFSYDSNGNLISVTPPTNFSHSFSYNGMEELASYQPPALVAGATNTTYTYNNDRKLTSITRPDAQTIAYSYDVTSGNLTSVTIPTGVYNYTYSATDQTLSQITGPNGIGNNFTYHGTILASDQQFRTSDTYSYGSVSFGFDSLHRITSRTVQPNSAAGASTTNYTYDLDDKLLTAGSLALTYSYPSGRLSSTTLNNITDSRSYDAFGNLQSYSASYTPSGAAAQVLYSYTLTRDVASRIVGKSEAVLGTTTTYVYGYDSAGRLTSVTENGNASASFTYDANSNRTSGAIDGAPFSATFDTQDRMLTFNSRTYTYNTNGEVTGIQMTPATSVSYVRDALGHLLQATTSNGTVLTYANDGRGRRVQKTAGTSLNWQAVYQDDLRMAAYVNNVSGVLAKEFVYGTGQSTPDYMNASGVSYRIITDHLGTPRLVVNSTTGAVAERLDYDVLGKIIRDSNSCFVPFGFAGGIFDTDTKLVHFDARDYDPSTGRWTSKDPILFSGGDTNLYGYVMNDPVNYTDPNGKSLTAAIGICSAAFTGAGVTAGLSTINEWVSDYQIYNAKVKAVNSNCKLDDVEKASQISQLDAQYQLQQSLLIKSLHTPGAASTVALAGCIAAISAVTVLEPF